MSTAANDDAEWMRPPSKNERVEFTIELILKRKPARLLLEQAHKRRRRADLLMMDIIEAVLTDDLFAAILD